MSYIEELIERLEVLSEGKQSGDAENWHYEADEILINIIKESLPTSLYGRIFKAFDELEKWYA